MAWRRLATVNLNSSWQYTPSFTSSIVRLRYLISPQPSSYYGITGLMAQGIRSAQLFDITKFYAKSEQEVFKLQSLPIPEWEKRSLAFRAWVRTGQIWKVLVDVWESKEETEINDLSTIDIVLNQLSQQLQEQVIDEIVSDEHGDTVTDERGDAISS